jgi:hypothetical protein
MAKNKTKEPKKELNAKLEASQYGSEIAKIQARIAAGSPYKNDQARLADLQGRTQVTTQPVVNPTPPPTTETVTPGINDSMVTSTGSITNPDDVLGQNKVFDPTDPYWQDLYKNTYNTQYQLSTAGLAERQARDLEDARQIAAERGIPFDPSNRESAYGKAIGGVTDRYDDLYSQADNAATIAANSTYEAQGGLANQGFAAYLQGVLGISAAQAQAKANEIQKYGIDEDTKAKLQLDSTNRYGIDKDYKAKMAAVAASGKSGGGGSSSGGSGSGGFDVVL